MLFILVWIAAVIGSLYYCSIRNFNYWKNKKVRGPKPVHFFGNLKDSTLRRKHVGSVYKEIYDQFPNESIVGIYRLTTPALLIRDLDLVKQILITDFDVFPERGIHFSKKSLGDNLFHCNSTSWKVIRHLVTPLFTPGKVKNAIPVMDKYAELLVDYLETANLENNEIEIHRIIQKYTMASTIEFFFYLDIDFFKENQELIEKAANSSFITSYMSEFMILFPYISNKIDVSLHSASIKKLCYDIVHIITNVTNDPCNKYVHLDVLMALKSDQGVEDEQKKELKLTDDVLAGQIFVLFGAGFGNNALVLSYALFHLAKHKDVQDKLIKEIDIVLEKHNGKLTFAALTEMSYLDKVFYETLRMNTLTNALQREAKRDYKIPGSEIVIEKGTTVLISPYAIHHDRNLYPNPDHFDPERFSSENTKKRHPCALMSFGVGPRSCIGRQLAKMQFATAIVRLFTKFRVQPSDKTRILEDYDPMYTLLATRGGVYINIVPRN